MSRVMKPSVASTAVSCLYCRETVSLPSSDAARFASVDEHAPPAIKVECTVCERKPKVIFDDAGFAETSSLAVELPPEILIAIFTEHARDVITLASVSLVSKFWNECAVPILYSQLELEWTSRVQSTLLHTLATHPKRHSHIRSIMKHQRALWPSRAPWNTPKAEQDDIYLRGRAIALSTGHGAWMDRGPFGKAPRIEGEGAFALFDLASRCPRLESLELCTFDSVSGDEDSSIRLSAQIPSVRRLSWDWPGRDRLTSLGADGAYERSLDSLLSRFPNLEELEMEHNGFVPPQSNVVLPRLVKLVVACLEDSETERVAPNLRHLDVADYRGEEESLADTIQRLRHLKSLRIGDLPHFGDEVGYPMSEDPEPAMLAALPKTSLRHISLPYPIRAILIESLPPTLTSLVIASLDRPTFDCLQETLRALIHRRPGLLPALAKVTVPSKFVKERSLVDEQVEAVMVGLEIEVADVSLPQPWEEEEPS